MTNLSELTCIPCKGGDPPLTEDEIASLQPQVPEWKVVTRDGVPRLERAYKFKDFAGALAFTNQVGRTAEEQDHHPTLLTQWGRVTVTWWTHAIKGLHQNDFVMAAKTDRLYEG